MNWLKKIILETIKLQKSNRKSEQVYTCSRIFSLPVEDKAFDFCSTTIPEIKKFVKEEINIDLDEVVICTFTSVICEENSTRQKHMSETYLEVVKKGKKHVGILLLKSDLKNLRVKEIKTNL